MSSEISRLSFEEAKHFLGVYQQMGRVQLDADANEQSEISLRLQQRHAGDTVRVGSPNHGFRVGTALLLDALEDLAGWVAEKELPGDPAPELFVDYMTQHVGLGCLVVQGGVAVARAFATALDWRDVRELIFYVKAPAAPTLFVRPKGGARIDLTALADGMPVNGWTVFRASTGGLSATELANIEEYGFRALQKSFRYQFDALEADFALWVQLLSSNSRLPFSATELVAGTPAVLSINDDDRVLASAVLQAEQAESVTGALEVVTDLTHVRALRFSVRSSQAGAQVGLRLIDADAATFDLGNFTVNAAGDYETFVVALPASMPGIDRSRISALSWFGLDAPLYLFGPVTMEMDLFGNLVVMGGDGTAEGAGRFYGDGLAAVLERHTTYFSQPSLPDADPTAFEPLSDDTTRSDLVYLDLWERPITYVEDPAIREPGLEGLDTCTRSQLVAQVRVLPGTAVALGSTPEPPLDVFNGLPSLGRGTLSTKDNPPAKLDPCADPCEPEVTGTFVGQDNRLYRVEIHRYGEIGPAGAATTAWFKWARDNGACVSATLENLPAGALSARVERVESFKPGDLVEISDDLVDLITGPYEDRVDRRRHQRGEMRRLTSVNLLDRRVSWEQAGSVDPLHAGLARVHRKYHHAKLRRWDGFAPVTSGDLLLDDGVAIEFGGEAFSPGDYWVFTARSVTRSVEQLTDAPARGIRHRYYPLAVVRRSRTGGVEWRSVEDKRPRFRALTALHAAGIGYDAGQWVNKDVGWDRIHTVQQAIDALCRLNLGVDLLTHNQMLHGQGVVCGLKVCCNHTQRGHVVIGKGYALDCAGHGIYVPADLDFDVLAPAETQGLLDAAGTGTVALTIARSAAGDAEIGVEAFTAQTLLERALENTLLKDFYDECIKSLLDWFKVQLTPFPASSVPVPESHRRTVTLIQLLWQLINPTSGPNVFVSEGEHRLLLQFYTELRSRLQSDTFCGMFDNATPFPEVYPFEQPVGGDTLFGLIGFHHRVRVHPTRPRAYSYGNGSTIFVYDLTTGEMTEKLEFPSGTNVDVQDLAFSGEDTVYAVALHDEDSVFCTATIEADGTHSWGPTTVVCDIHFVSLGTSPLHAGNLYAIGRALGFYVFTDPDNIPLAPTAAVSFNATGRLLISLDTEQAFAAEAAATPLGTVSSHFTRIREIDLNNASNAAPLKAHTVSGADFDNDFAFASPMLWVTGDPAPGHVKTLRRFNTVTNALATIDLGVDDVMRLAIPAKRDRVFISILGSNILRAVDTQAGSLVPNYRVPLQVFPLDVDVVPDGSRMYAINMLGTLSEIDVDRVLEASNFPSYVLEPFPPAVPDTLGDFRQQMVDAFLDLLKGLGQKLKDCFCGQFIVDCPKCTPDDKVYLGTVEFQNGQTYNICNFDKRHYVKSFRTYGYWLSALPIHRVFKEAFKQFCCLVLP
jgi:hypothetical protein